MPAILLVEDNDDHAIIAQAALTESEYRFKIDRASSAEECFIMLGKEKYDAIALDYSMPRRNGIEALRDIMEMNYDAPVIMITSHGDEDLAVVAMKYGAYDYISKSGDYLTRFPLVIDKAIERHQIAREKAELQAQIAESENILRTISENAEAGLIQIGHDCSILYANPRARNYLGMNGGQAKPEVCSIFSHGEVCKDSCVGCAVKKCFENGGVIKRETAYNGRDLSITISVASAESSNEVKLVVAAIMDITRHKELHRQLKQRTEELAGINKELHQEIDQRRQAEAALKEERSLLAQRVEERTFDLKEANEQLSKANRLKDEFLASMSHELRTPLSAVSGACQILQSGMHGPLARKQVEDLQIIEDSSSHLLELINDILDIAKIGSGRLELDMGPVAVQSVCQSSLQFVVQAAAEKKLRVSSSMDRSVNILQADERRLKEMLTNLLSNAVKFTPDGGQIGLEVIGHAESQMVDFVVWDTGIGISQEDMELLFQPFVQLDGKLSRQYSGTGLGLALVQKMSELHGGKVIVESEAGQGSRFTISLPWKKISDYGTNIGAMDSVETAICPERDSRSIETFNNDDEVENPLILLAEDDSANAELTSNMLRFKGYSVVVAGDGNEAVQKAKEMIPDVILMDIQMPGMDGLEAIRHIRNDAELVCVPVIALTALAMSGDREMCLEAGADDYVVKPVNMEALARIIEILRVSRHDGTFAVA